MLILILIDVQYSQKLFSFEKGSNCQKHSSGSLTPYKKSPPPWLKKSSPSKISDFLASLPLPLFGNPGFKFIIVIFFWPL